MTSKLPAGLRRLALLGGLALLTLLAPVPAIAAPVTITFDDLPAETTVTDQYQSQGVIFNGNYIAEFGPTHGGPQALDLTTPGNDVLFGPIVAKFTHAMSAVSLFAGSVFGPNQQGTLRAFDIHANLLATDGPKPLGETITTAFSVSVPSASIASVTFTQTPFGKPRIDDLTFDDGGTSVPLPISGNHTTSIDFSQEQAIQLRPPGSIIIPSVFATVIITNPGGSGSNGGSPVPEGTEACTGSRADNIGWTYYHEAYDYLTDGTVSASDCGACGCSAPVREDLPGQMQRLRVKRLLRPHLGYVVSSFGPTMFGTFDAKIRLYPGSSTNQPHADVFDIESNVQPISMLELSSGDGDNTVDGAYHDVAGRQYKDLRLTDSSGHPLTQPVPGALAVLTKQTGERLIFEVINTQAGGSSSVLDARLIRSEDRNHNAELVSYVFAATATDAQLSNDRTRLWQIKSVSDPYGATGTFQYGTQQVSGRWVVNMITAPTGQTIRYLYAGGTNIGLTGVAFADGTTSSFSTTSDPANQEIGLVIDDNAAGPGRVKKTVYVSQATFTLPSGQVVSQPANLVRRVFNGAGELVYRNWEDPASSNTFYIYEGAGSLIRLVVSSDGFPLSYARASAPFDPNKSPTAAAFEVQETYVEGTPGQLTHTTDALGRSASLTRDVLSRAVSAATYYDGSNASSTYNQYREPLQVVDNVGKVTTASYDAAGNLLSMTLAAGTAAAGTLSYTYNSRGQPLTSSDPNGNVTSYQYDAAGNLVAITEPADVSGGARAVTTMAYDASGRMTSTTDADGRVVRFSYDGRNRLVTRSFPDGSNEVFTYGSDDATANLLVLKRDRNGHADTFSYDSASRLIGVVRASGMPEAVSESWTYLPGTKLRAQQVQAGEQTVFTYDQRKRRVATTKLTSPSQSLTDTIAYDAVDRKARETDPYGRNTFYVYDSAGRQTRIVTERVPGAVAGGANLATLPRDTTPNPGYTILDRTFDAQGRTIAEVDGRGSQTTFSYDVRGRLVQKILGASTASAAKTTYQYDTEGNVTLESRPRSFDGEGGQFATASTFSGRNLRLSRTEAVGTADASTTSYTYTPTQQKATEKDGRGNVVSYAYDTCCNRLVQLTDQAGQITRYTYDFNGNRASITDPNGNVTHDTYDALNRLVSSVDPRGKATATSYDDNLTDGVGVDAKYASLLAGLSFGPGADGSASVTTDPLGEVTVVVNDPLRRRLRKVDGNLNATTITYDVVVNGLLERAETDALGHTTRTRADGARLDRESVDADGNTSRFAYDGDGNRLQRRDPNGTGDDCSYDPLNRQTSCTDTNNNTSSTTYDVEGNKLTTTDGVGKLTACSYDSRNRKKTCTDRIGGVQRYAYDADSNLSQLTDPDGSVTAYQYDARNLQTKITYPGGGTRQFAYDQARRLASMTRQDGAVVTYAYDTANRLLTRHYPDGKDDTFGYDDANRLTQANSARYQTGVSRSYDAASRLTSDAQTVFGVMHTVSYTYDPADRMTVLTYPDGSTVAHQYTERNQLAGVASGSTTLATFTYDPGERLIATQLGNGRTENRSYESDNLLASAVTTGIADFEYTYDHNKRKLTEGNGVSTGESQTFAYDGEDRVVSWSKQAGDTQTWQLSLANDWRGNVKNGVTETRTHDSAHQTLTVNGTALTYDPQGNLTRNSRGDTYAWDFDDQLKTATVGGKQTSYIYDPLGRRLGKTLNGVSVTLVNDDENVVAEYGGSSLLRTYVYGDYADRALALKANGATYYVTANSLYTVAAITNSAGSLVERYSYDAYGSRTVTLANGSRSPTSSVGNPYGFTGRYHDDETGLIYFRARYYDPALGRFVSRDKTYRDGPNLYAAYFVPNHLDPSGRGFKAGVKGEADLQLGFCDGGKLDAILKGWAGVGYDYHGIFVGLQWEGQLTSHIADNLFGNTFDCGTNCAWCCEDPYAPAGFTSTGLGSLITPLTKALESVGVKCSIETKITECVKGLGLECEANLLETAFPELAPVLEALKEVGVEVEAGFQLAVDFEFCRSAESNWALKEANFLGGAYIEVGYGL